MKAVIQRVKNASVSVGGRLCGSINEGLLVYLGVAAEDTEHDAVWMAEKAAHLRIFNDAERKMNLSITDINSRSQTPLGILIISQFTLCGDANKGRRPSWAKAAPPEKAKQLYEYFINKLREQNLTCENDEFQAYMQVSYTNDGPVTIILDSAYR